MGDRVLIQRKFVVDGTGIAGCTAANVLLDDGRIAAKEYLDRFRRIGVNATHVRNRAERFAADPCADGFGGHR